MTNKLPDSIKSLVIQQWLQGLSRDTIAANNGLSAGAVTSIVNEWRQALGSTTGTELRELAVTLKKIGINHAQCATGFRVATMMTKLGVKEENFELFMSDVYNPCRDQGITPENIASYLTDLIEFSKNVPLSKMSDYIQQKTHENEKLEQRKGELNDQKWELIGKIDELNTRHIIALGEEKITSDNLKWYSDLKAELRKYGIPVDDISQLAKVVSGIRQYGYNTEKVLNEFSNLELLKAQCQGYQGSIARLKNEYDTLNRDCYFLQQWVSSYNQSLSKYNELEAMGFGLKELKLLWHTIREIAVANNIPLDNAIQKFCKDINEQYDVKLGLESKVDKLQAEVNSLIQAEARLRTQLLMLPSIGPLLRRLSQSGVRDQDLVDIAELLKNDAGVSSSKGSIGIEEIRSLIAAQRAYGSIKSIIKQLNQKVDKLRNQVASLRAENQDLDAQNQKMFSTLQYSKQLVDFFSGSFVSLRNEITGLVSFMAYIIYLLNSEVQRLQKSQDDGSHPPPDDEFVPLAMAARGEAVDPPKLKVAVLKAIEVMLEKLKGGDKMMTTEIFCKARLALENEQF